MSEGADERTGERTSAIRVLLVDDHVIVRQGLRQVLQSDAGFAVVGEASSGAEAITLALASPPDVVLLDITMPGESGLTLVPRLRRELPQTRVLILSVHDDAEYVLESVRAGAHGYLRKDTTPADLRAAVRAVHSGDAYFSPAVARQISESLRVRLAPNESPRAESASAVSPPALSSATMSGGAASPAAASPAAASLDVLTNREREVLALVARGRLNKEIGVQLGISVRTVEAHRDSLVRKLSIRSAAGLTRFALETGLLGEDSALG